MTLHVTPPHVTAINALCNIVNEWATSKGWNEGEDSIMRKSSDIALMHSELSECLEFVRKKVETLCPNCADEDWSVMQQHSGSTVTKTWYKCKTCRHEIDSLNVAFDDHVTSLTGEAAELADVLIRIFHYCGRRGINLGEAVRLKHEYNITRPYKHGKNL